MCAELVDHRGIGCDGSPHGHGVADMSVQAMAWAWEQDTGSVVSQIMLVALANFADEAGACWPSQTTLSLMTKASPRAVRKHLAELVGRNLIAREERRFADGTRTTDRYRLMAPPERLSPGAKPPARGAASAANKRHVVPEPPARGAANKRHVVPGEPSGSNHHMNHQRSEPAATLFSSEGITATDDVDLAYQAWNAMATEAGLPTVRKLTKPLHASLKGRLSECGGIEGWHGVLERVRQSDFLCGAGDRGWRATLKWLAKPGNIENVMAGNYDNRNKAHRENGNDKRNHDTAAGRHRAGAAISAAADLAADETD